MKTRIFWISVITAVIVVFSIQQTGFAQSDKDKDKKTAKADKIKTLVLNKQYVFVAQTMMPTGYSSRQLNTYYDVSVLSDTLISYLPYMGRAYSAQYGSSDSPLSFTSRKFDYTQTDRKKGGWEITIKTKDISADTYTYQFTIYDNGTAYLQVTSNNRQPISFNGYITKRPEKKK